MTLNLGPSSSASSAPKGPSVDAVRKQKEAAGEAPRVKVQDILLNRGKTSGPSVEEARAAMIAAGEAPRGNPNEARPANAPRRAPAAQTLQPYADAPLGYAIRFTEMEAVRENGKVVHKPTGVVDVIQVPDKVTATREIKKRQNIAVAAKLAVQVEVAEITEDEPAPAVQQVIPPQSTVVVQPQPAERGDGGSTRSEGNKVERIENRRFILEIAQEDGEWVGRITYKNGAGTEEFSAPTRRELDMKLLEGKANATLKVREVLHEQKYGVDLDKTYEIPGYSQTAFDALTPEAQTLVIDGIAMRQAIIFKETTPEFYPTKENSDKIQAYLHKRELPITLKNLKYAFERIADDLDQRVSVAEPAPAVAPVAADSAPSVAPAAPVSTVAAPAPAPVVRKRGSFDFKPGYTSIPTDIPEEGVKSTEPSERDLRIMPLADLAKLTRKGYKHPSF